MEEYYLPAQNAEDEKKISLRHEHMDLALSRRAEMYPNVYDQVFTLFRPSGSKVPAMGKFRRLLTDFIYWLNMCMLLVSAVLSYFQVGLEGNASIDSLLALARRCVVRMRLGAADIALCDALCQILRYSAGTEGETETWVCVQRANHVVREANVDYVNPYFDVRNVNNRMMDIVTHNPQLMYVNVESTRYVEYSVLEWSANPWVRVLQHLCDGARIRRRDTQGMIVSLVLAAACLKHRTAYWSDAIAKRIAITANLESSINISEQLELEDVRTNTARYVIACCQLAAQRRGEVLNMDRVSGLLYRDLNRSRLSFVEEESPIIDSSY